MTTAKKPIQLRIVFILNALMMILPFIFYFIFTTNDIAIDGLNPTWMLYTGIGYIISFIPLAYFIIKRNRIGVLTLFGINILIALPTKAFIGIIVAIISFILTFTKKSRLYFQS